MAGVKSQGELILLSLIYPASLSKMSEEQRGIFSEAVVLQDEYMAGGMQSGSVKSERVGDVSITYRDGGDMVVSGGAAICPAAVAKLRLAGILSSWV